MELTEGLQFKLWMFGVPINGPTNMIIDRNSIVCKSAHPESALRKKHNAIRYPHMVEAIVTGMI